MEETKESNADEGADKKSAKDAPLNAKEEISEFLKTAIIALLLALILRGFLYEPFNIPSGSMKPTLEVGDYLFTNKFAYGYGQYSFSLPFNIFFPVPYEGRAFAEEPKRGDIAVFWIPKLGQHYIKRIIGMPGETIQVKRGRLYINGEQVYRELISKKTLKREDGRPVLTNQYWEILPGGIEHLIYEEIDSDTLDNTPVYTVPEGHYFMMGDNRDNSQDSRVMNTVGPIPFENIVGRADVLFFSTNGYAKIFEVWKWPWSLRYDRFFKSIRPKIAIEEQ